MLAACPSSRPGHLVPRRVVVPGSSTLASTRSTSLPQRDVKTHSEKLEGRESVIDSDRSRKDATKRDSSPPPPRPAPSDAAPTEESTNDGPPDQRPMLVRIIMSVFRSFWQSIGRVWEVLPGTKPLRIVFFLFVLAVYNTMRGPTGASAAAPVEVLYSQFVQLARARVIHSALVDDQSSVLYFSIDQGKLKYQKGGKRRWWWRQSDNTQASVASKQTPSGYRSFSTRLVDKDTSYVQVLIDSGVPFGVKKQTLEGAISKLAGAFLALWIPLIPFFFLFKRVMDSQSGKSKKTKQNYEPPDTTFEDVAGVDVVKAELQEAVQCLRDPARFEKLNAQMPSGVLLTGPPGTGKTLLARAVAGEAGVPFFAVSASEFVEMFVGRGAARIRELFAQARKASPAVVFIDELDAVGGKRGLGVNDERDQTLNQLLTELDGFEKRPSILLLAATNRPEVLDQALLRPGRISRRIVVPLPDESGRQSILRVHLRGVPMESEDARDLAVEHLSAITPGFSGAELFNVVNEGALLTARRGGEYVGITDLVAGVQRTRDGVNGRRPVLTAAAQKLSGFLKGFNAEPARASPMF